VCQSRRNCLRASIPRVMVHDCFASAVAYRLNDLTIAISLMSDAPIRSVWKAAALANVSAGNVSSCANTNRWVGVASTMASLSGWCKHQPLSRWRPVCNRRSESTWTTGGHGCSETCALNDICYIGTYCNIGSNTLVCWTYEAVVLWQDGAWFGYGPYPVYTCYISVTCGYILYRVICVLPQRIMYNTHIV
jgi:hypothetical protein